MKCSIEGCEREAEVRGWCKTVHYKRFTRFGDPRGSALRSIGERFWEKVDRSEDCWRWTAASKSVSGYGTFGFGRRPVGAHRVSWMLSYGEIPDGLFVLHKCDNRLCVRPSHLFLGTQADNMRDKVEKDRQRKGRENGGKLTDDDVRVIRYLVDEREVDYGILADIFGVSRSAIHLVATNQTWRHVVAS